MKTPWPALFAALAACSPCFGGDTAPEAAGKVCLNIPERGAEMVKIANSCKQGDIIKLHKMYIALLCDFNHAIVHYEGADHYICVYLGKKRELREGTN